MYKPGDKVVLVKNCSPAYGFPDYRARIGGVHTVLQVFPGRGVDICDELCWIKDMTALVPAWEYRLRRLCDVTGSVQKAETRQGL